MLLRFEAPIKLNINNKNLDKSKIPLDYLCINNTIDSFDNLTG
mgnify:CR=1 FL=1|jgi:hypothetical protein